MSNSNPRISDKQIIDACLNNISMRQASIKVGLHFNTFVRRAKQLNCYKPNQGLKGITKKDGKGGGIKSINIDEILQGLYPSYQTLKLKKRLISLNLIENKCAICGIKIWNNKPICLELDHIDGDNSNHKRKNLRLLCPNCHSQTNTYRGKNSKHKKFEP